MPYSRKMLWEMMRFFNLPYQTWVWMTTFYRARKSPILWNLLSLTTPSRPCRKVSVTPIWAISDRNKMSCVIGGLGPQGASRRWSAWLGRAAAAGRRQVKAALIAWPLSRWPWSISWCAAKWSGSTCRCTYVRVFVSLCACLRTVRESAPLPGESAKSRCLLCLKS